MSVHTPTSLRAVLARFTLGAFVLFAGSISLGAFVMYRTWRVWETGFSDRAVRWVSLLIDRRAADVRESAAARGYSEEALAVITHENGAAAWQRLLSEERAMLARSGFDMLLLFDEHRRQRLSWMQPGTALSTGELPDGVFDVADSAGAYGGYVRLGDSVYRVGAATVWDDARRRPAGYIVLGAPVSAAFLASQVRGIDIPVQLSLVSAAERSPAPRGDTLVIHVPLKDVSGAPIGRVRVALDRSLEGSRVRLGFVVFALVLLGGGIASWLTWWWGHRLLVRPLKQTVRELESMASSQTARELHGDLPVVEWEALRTAFNAAVRARSEYERRYRDVFDRAADAIFLVDPASGRVVDANPATATLTGVAASDMIGRPLPAELVQSGAGQRIVRWRRADGVTQTWGVVVSDVTGDRGPLLLAVYRDLTGREAMAHAQKMEAVGSLAGGIAHDFNNLMAAVLTGVTAARTLVGGSHPAVAALDGIQHAGTRAAELTRQLLNFSRHDPPRLEPVDLQRSIETVAAICTRTFDPRIAVASSIAPDLPMVLGDAGELEQALLNLCINARDAMPSGGSLRIDARRRELDAAQARTDGLSDAGVFVELTVSDNGTGMTDEVKARLFEPFFTTKEPGRGTGLGLSLVYGLTRQLGGAISVQSTVGQGTRVRLLFRAHVDRAAVTPAPAEPPLERRAEAPAGERPVILVVDDERGLREMMRMVLDISGFDVLEAPDGARALSQFGVHRDRIRCILLDMQLPGELSGLDTLERIRTLDEKVPVLLCTGYVRDDDPARLRQLAVEDVLQKPLDINSLLTRLDTICGRSTGGAAASGANRASTTTVG